MLKKQAKKNLLRTRDNKKGEQAKIKMTIKPEKCERHEILREKTPRK